MKKIGCLWMVFLCLLLVGCSSGSYERDTGEGKIEMITLEEMGKKMKKGDAFAVAFTQEMCGYCKEYHAMLDTYLKDHNVTMYEVDLTAEPKSENENAEIIHQYFPTFNSTPGIYYAKKGKVVNSLTDNTKEMNEKMFDQWVQKNKLDNKK